jgi:transcriptional regulator with XRE-family HTH domain
MNTIIGNRLKKLRRSKGMSQEQVADYLHLSRSAYARIESGESHSWASYLTEICQVFEITPEELVKSDTIVVNINEQEGVSANGIIINQLSEKLIEQYEERIQELKQIISDLRENQSVYK